MAETFTGKDNELQGMNGSHYIEFISMKTAKTKVWKVWKESSRNIQTDFIPASTTRQRKGLGRKFLKIPRILANLNEKFDIGKINRMDDQGAVPIQDWGLDPYFSSYRKLLINTIIHEVVTLDSNGLLLHYLFKKPISKVEIVGVVVSIDHKAKRVTLYVDDGTEIIRCVKYLDGITNCHLPVHVGDTALVKGNLEKFSTNAEDYRMGIRIAMIERLEDLNAEIYHGLAAMELYNNEYR